MRIKDALPGLSVLLELSKTLTHQRRCHSSAFRVCISSRFYGESSVALWSALEFLAVAQAQELRSSSLQLGHTKRVSCGRLSFS